MAKWNYITLCIVVSLSDDGRVDNVKTLTIRIWMYFTHWFIDPRTRCMDSWFRNARSAVDIVPLIIKQSIWRWGFGRLCSFDHPSQKLTEWHFCLYIDRMDMSVDMRTRTPGDSLTPSGAFSHQLLRNFLQVSRRIISPGNEANMLVSTFVNTPYFWFDSFWSFFTSWCLFCREFAFCPWNTPDGDKYDFFFSSLIRHLSHLAARKTEKSDFGLSCRASGEKESKWRDLRFR